MSNFTLVYSHLSQRDVTFGVKFAIAGLVLVHGLRHLRRVLSGRKFSILNQKMKKK